MKSNLRVLRAKDGISQEELANKIKVPRAFISALENGKVKSVKINTLIKLSQELHNCPIQDLLYFVPEDSKKPTEKAI